MTKNVWGLTGGVGSGKTTLANFLKKIDKNIVVFDCDEVAKNIMTDMAQKTGMVFDKKKMAKIIFSDPKEKEKIEKLIHPKVLAEATKQLSRKLDELINREKEEIIILVESAILFNIEKEKNFSKIIATICNLEERKKRIKLRNNWSETEINERIKNQVKEDVLIKKALVIVNTEGKLEELKTKAEKLYQYLKENKKEKLIL